MDFFESSNDNDNRMTMSNTWGNFVLPPRQGTVPDTNPEQSMMLLPPALPPVQRQEQQQPVRKKATKPTANTRDTSDGAVDEEAPARAAFARSQAVKALVRGFYSEVSKHRIAFPSHEARHKAFLAYKMASLKAAGCTSFVNSGLSCSVTQLKEVWDQHDQRMQQKYAASNTSHTTTTKKKAESRQRIRLPMSHKLARRAGPISTTSTSPPDAMDNSAATALISLATVAGSMNETSTMNGRSDSNTKDSKKRKAPPKREDSDDEYSDEFEWTDDES